MEFPAIYLHEHNPHTLEYWDQPPKITLRYERADRKIAFQHTPDFFLLSDAEVGYEEWKPEEKLVELSCKDPARYQRDEAGGWRCPPGEAVAAR